MSQKRGQKMQARFEPFDLAGNYTELNIYGNQHYIIMWKPKLELRVVTGAFIRGHFDKCKVLSNPHESKRLLEESLANHGDKYLEFYSCPPAA